MHRLILFVFLFISLNLNAQEVLSPDQPMDGPGGKEYLHDEVKQYDFADESDGYWLYEPAKPTPKSANVIVFIHGYGAYNPMIYGKWIKHLVRKGNIVIFPRYQKNLVSPSSKKFVSNVVIAIKDALEVLESDGHVRPLTKHFSLVGHSYGGVISANLAVTFEKHDIPKPKAALLVSPGTGPFKGALLKSYDEMPEDLNLLVMVSDRDQTVGDKIGALIYKTAEKVKNRNLIRQYSDYHGSVSITSGHNESYSVDKDFDSGVKNFSTKRAIKVGKFNAIDFLGYWKLFDALNAFTRNGKYKNYAFGNTPEQRNLGYWSDGTKVKELEIIVPDQSIAERVGSH